MTSFCDITRVFWDPDTLREQKAFSVVVARGRSAALISVCAGDAIGRALVCLHSGLPKRVARIKAASLGEGLELRDSAVLIVRLVLGCLCVVAVIAILITDVHFRQLPLFQNFFLWLHFTAVLRYLLIRWQGRVTAQMVRSAASSRGDPSSIPVQ
jgi:hypothetical protein